MPQVRAPGVRQPESPQEAVTDYTRRPARTLLLRLPLDHDQPPAAVNLE
jgi:hypothetical protein